MTISWSILVKWLECRFLDKYVDGSNTDSVSMLCPRAGGDTIVKGAQCYELFGGIAFKNRAFHRSSPVSMTRIFILAETGLCHI